ncbi:MAG: 4Fe-4S dicluster domain-containing protein [Phycisphaerae bacterium]|nr:4Fe-4S dicluster domain-containing protein [Phycisphaerae bacterium]
MSLNRRQFLKCMGLAGVSTGAAASTAEASTAPHAGNDWHAMLTDLTLCVGCRKCEWACRKANGPTDPGPIDAYDDPSVFEQRRRTNSISLTVVNRVGPTRDDEKPTFVKSQCMHCCEPACASACLVGAYRKSKLGPVIYDESVCIGCRYCMVACPFDMPAFSYNSPTRPAIHKCTMCFERLAKGDGAPACASICPVEAITFGKRSELLALARRKIAAEPKRYVNHIFGEYEAGGTCWLYIAGRPFEELGFPANVGTRPYPELTKGLLSAVPFIQVIWPAVLMGAYAFSHRRETATSANDARDTTEGTEPGSES